MPIYEFKCMRCDNDFEVIMSMNAKEATVCPSCHSADTEKLLSVFGCGSSSVDSGSSCGNSRFT